MKLILTTVFLFFRKKKKSSFFDDAIKEGLKDWSREMGYRKGR